MQYLATCVIYESMIEDGLQADLNDAGSFVRALSNDPDKVCYIATVGRELAGCVIGIWHADEAQPCYEVRNLYVRSEHRSRGVAQRLMKALLDWAYEDNAPIYITTEGQPRPFYRKLGFEPVREICGSTLATIRERLGDVSTEDFQSGEVG